MNHLKEELRPRVVKWVYPQTTSSESIIRQLEVCGYPHLTTWSLSSSLKTIMWWYQVATLFRWQHFCCCLPSFISQDRHRGPLPEEQDQVIGGEDQDVGQQSHDGGEQSQSQSWEKECQYEKQRQAQSCYNVSWGWHGGSLQQENRSNHFYF